MQTPNHWIFLRDAVSALILDAPLLDAPVRETCHGSRRCGGVALFGNLATRMVLMILLVGTHSVLVERGFGQVSGIPSSGGLPYRNQGLAPSFDPAYPGRGQGPDDSLNGWEDWIERNQGQRGVDRRTEVLQGAQLQAEPIVDPNLPPPTFIEASRIVARVGSHVIVAGDIYPEINELIEAKIPTMPEVVKEQQRQKLLEQLIPKAVEQKLMYADAIQQLPDKVEPAEALVSVMDQFTEVEMPRLLEAHDLTNATELDALLRRYGGSLRRHREQWAENQLIGFMVRQQISFEPEVTHQELLDYYQENIDSYVIKGKARWSELMVSFDRFPNREQAYRAIAEMGNEVVHGAPFEAVAQRRSHGFTKENGGHHDFTTQGALRDQAIDQALFELPINYLSDILESKAGFHIVRVLERQEESYVSFRDAQIEIREKLQKEKQSEQLESYMARIRERIPVWTILDDPQAETASR